MWFFMSWSVNIWKRVATNVIPTAMVDSIILRCFLFIVIFVVLSNCVGTQYVSVILKVYLIPIHTVSRRTLIYCYNLKFAVYKYITWYGIKHWFKIKPAITLGYSIHIYVNQDICTKGYRWFWPMEVLNHFGPWRFRPIIKYLRAKEKASDLQERVIYEPTT